MAARYLLRPPSIGRNPSRTGCSGEDHFADVVYDSLSDSQADGLSALSFRAGTSIEFRET